jgi:hypothetical protein
MQHDRPRWVSVADIHDEREFVRSAAKLLNVAITRTQHTLHLIGNWNDVRTGTAPGMRALASVAGRPEFRLVRHG